MHTKVGCPFSFEGGRSRAAASASACAHSWPWPGCRGTGGSPGNHRHALHGPGDHDPARWQHALVTVDITVTAQMGDKPGGQFICDFQTVGGADHRRRDYHGLRGSRTRLPQSQGLSPSQLSMSPPWYVDLSAAVRHRGQPATYCPPRQFVCSVGFSCGEKG